MGYVNVQLITLDPPQLNEQVPEHCEGTSVLLPAIFRLVWVAARYANATPLLIMYILC
jgi:hypothetical protein